MCDTCESLAGKVAAAEADGNAEKARVMRSLLDSHRKYCHTTTNVVAVGGDHVTWPDGTRWVVR